MKWINVVLVNIVIECICLLGNTNAERRMNQSFDEDPYGPLFSSAGYPRTGDIPMLNRKVFRGMRVSILEHPYVVSIRRNYAHYLTGTLLNRNVIISVAHPVFGVPLIELSVVVGENYADRGSTALTIVIMVIHENFDAFTLVSDIALFRIFEDVNYRTTVKPVLTTFENNISYVNKLAFVTGWGRCDMTGRELCLPRSSIYFSNEAFDPMLRTVSFEIKQSSFQTYCNGYHRHETDIKEGMLCMGDAREDNPVSPCLAVPGAPLTVSGKLLGIQSWGFGCGYNHDLPLIYTSMEYYKRFKNFSNTYSSAQSAVSEEMLIKLISWIIENLNVLGTLKKINMSELFEATKAVKLHEMLKLTRKHVVPEHEHRDDELQASGLDRSLAALRGDVYDLRDFIGDQRFHQSKKNMYAMIRVMLTRLKKLHRMTDLPYRQKRPFPFISPTLQDDDELNSDGPILTVDHDTDAEDYDDEEQVSDNSRLW